MGKVGVPEEVAKALDFLRTVMNDDRILYLLASGKDKRELDMIIGGEAVAAILTTKSMTPLKTAEALLVGYEVEKTPEEKIVEYYADAEDCAKSLLSSVSYCGIMRKEAVKFVLEAYGITIKGVSA